MNTRNMTVIDLMMQQKRKEYEMSTTTLAEQKDVSRHTDESAEGSGEGRRNLSVVIGSLLALLAGVAVFWVTGLYEGMSSAAGRIGVGTALSLVYLFVFRRAIRNR